MSKAQLERGARLVELLKQPLNSPMPVEEQVITVSAGTTGTLDSLPVNQVKAFEAGLLEYFRTTRVDLLDAIRTTGALPDGVADAIAAFKERFVAEHAAAELPVVDPTTVIVEEVDESVGVPETLKTE